MIRNKKGPSTLTNLNDDDCGCGKSLKIRDPRRKKVAPKRTIKKRNNLK